MKFIIKNIISRIKGSTVSFTVEDKKILSLIFDKENQSTVFFNENEYLKSTKTNKVLISSSDQFNGKKAVSAFHSICNNDGSIRWIFPSKSVKPNFLKFYNISSFKSKVFAAIINMAYQFKLVKYISSNTFYLFSEAPTFLETIIKRYEAIDFAIFTGTVGPNRKILLWLQSNKSEYFVKIPTNNRSCDLVKNEVKQCNYIQTLAIQNLKTPQTYFDINNQIAVLKSVASEDCTRENKLTDLHLSVLNRIYESNNKITSIENSTFWQEAMSNFAKIKNTTFASKIKTNLQQLIDSINTKEIATFSLMHGDFTPWNMYVEDDQLCLYDWELSKPTMPLYFDIFHFIMQKNILIERKGYEETKREITKTFEHSQLAFINDNIDWVDYFKGYLIYNTIYNLQLFEEQEHLHEQANWLMNNWNEAIKDIVTISSNKNQKEEFTNKLFSFLNKKEYALLKFSERSLKKIPANSDLDILINSRDLKSILNHIQTSREVQKLNIHNLSFASYLEIFFKNKDFLRIDLIHQFKRKNFEMFDKDQILQSTTLTTENIKVPQTKYDFEYCLLFYFLNKSGIPNKYIDFFSALPEQEKAEIDNYISDKYKLKYDLSSLNQHNTAIENKVLETVVKNNSNLGISKIKNNAKYLIDTIKNTLFQKGLIVTFSGVDGAGKSTIIEIAKNNIQQKYRKKLIVLRHRPSVLPILSSFKYGKKNAEQRAANKLPRQGNNKSKLSSTLRFLYYFADYLFGQIYVYFRYVCRGYIVLYDRYYFDFINDAKRSNINVNKKLVKFLYNFVYKPDLNFFLYADPEIILSRKKELEAKDITMLTENYSNLFDEFEKNYTNSKYVQINNIDLEETMDKVMFEFGKAV